MADQRNPLKISLGQVLLESCPNLSRQILRQSPELHLARQTDEELCDRQVADQKLLGILHRAVGDLTVHLRNINRQEQRGVSVDQSLSSSRISRIVLPG